MLPASWTILRYVDAAQLGSTRPYAFVYARNPFALLHWKITADVKYLYNTTHHSDNMQKR
jgi:hypothetical protein